MIPEGARVLFIDEAGKKFITTAAKTMIEVGGLGVVDGRLLCEASFGDRMAIGGQQFTILRPSIRDTLGVMDRKTQIMLPKDSFLIPLYLDIGSGSRVIEGGVGSGALTLVLLRAVGPDGRVYSYEIREDHAALARRNVSLSEFQSCWELRMDDICSARLQENVDAVVVDIPNPWDAADNAVRALRPGGHLCCYVPNVNQLENTVRRMRDLGLAEVTSFETLQREMIVHEGGVRPSFDMLGHTGYLVIGRKIR
ncbi:MAG: tRNA (adenine-N1)-methyltransferase [Thermoplasmata archaeon]